MITNPRTFERPDLIGKVGQRGREELDFQWRSHLYPSLVWLSLRRKVGTNSRTNETDFVPLKLVSQCETLARDKGAGNACSSALHSDQTELVSYGTISELTIQANEANESVSAL